MPVSPIERLNIALNLTLEEEREIEELIARLSDEEITKQIEAEKVRREFSTSLKPIDDISAEEAYEKLHPVSDTLKAAYENLYPDGAEVSRDDTTRLVNGQTAYEELYPAGADEELHTDWADLTATEKDNFISNLRRTHWTGLSTTEQGNFKRNLPLSDDELEVAYSISMHENRMMARPDADAAAIAPSGLSDKQKTKVKTDLENHINSSDISNFEKLFQIRKLQRLTRKHVSYKHQYDHDVHQSDGWHLRKNTSSDYARDYLSKRLKMTGASLWSTRTASSSFVHEHRWNPLHVRYKKANGLVNILSACTAMGNILKFDFTDEQLQKAHKRLAEAYNANRGPDDSNPPMSTEGPTTKDEEAAAKSVLIRKKIGLPQFGSEGPSSYFTLLQDTIEDFAAKNKDLREAADAVYKAMETPTHAGQDALTYDDVGENYPELIKQLENAHTEMGNFLNEDDGTVAAKLLNAAAWIHDDNARKLYDRELWNFYRNLAATADITGFSIDRHQPFFKSACRSRRVETYLSHFAQTPGSHIADMDQKYQLTVTFESGGTQGYFASGGLNMGKEKFANLTPDDLMQAWQEMVDESKTPTPGQPRQPAPPHPVINYGFTAGNGLIPSWTKPNNSRLTEMQFRFNDQQKATFISKLKAISAEKLPGPTPPTVTVG